MMYPPIKLQSITLSFPGKLCFSNFSAMIHYGSKIAIIGRNGTGKTSLLKILNQEIELDEGSIMLPKNLSVASVPQLFPEGDLSGAERFNAALTKALAQDPDVLLLDEPTNHLDQHMKRNLLRLLDNFRGTLILVSHDEDLLRTIPTEFWYIEDGTIQISSGTYETFIEQQMHSYNQIQSELKQLKKKERSLSKAKQLDQKMRARKGKVHANENDRTIKGRLKETASKSSGRYHKKLNEQKQKLIDTLQATRLPEVITPSFTLNAPHKSKKLLISVQDGACGYDKPIARNINLNLTFGERVALTGKNASGKTTLIKALMGDQALRLKGAWEILSPDEIGYLDQHYTTLSDEETVLSMLEKYTPDTPTSERRKHLASFLFRTNEEVMASVGSLSGGEKARLSLACIAAQNPPLIIVDEITNNLDRETKEHLVEALNAYPGGLLIVSHEEQFLKRLTIGRTLTIVDGSIEES